MTGMEFTIFVLIVFVWCKCAALTLFRIERTARVNEGRDNHVTRHIEFYLVLTFIAWIPINLYWLWQKLGGRT